MNIVQTTARFAVLSSALPAQTFDFKESLDGFAADASSFTNQPLEASTILAPASLGGDYWTSLPYPMGQHGRYLIATAMQFGDGATGTLVSRPIPVAAGPRYFSLLVGGTEDAARERVELQPRMSLEEQIAFQSRTGLLNRDGDFVLLRYYTGARIRQSEPSLNAVHLALTDI